MDDDMNVMGIACTVFDAAFFGVILTEHDGGNWIFHFFVSFLLV